MPKNFPRRGVVPLFVLLLIGVAVLIGGVYVVREQFLKQGKSGKTTYDEAKIKEQAKNPQALPEIKEEAKGQLASSNFVYQPKETSSTISAAPAFSINPPVGWEKFSPGGATVVQFKSTQEDRVNQEDGLYAKSKAQIGVVMLDYQGKGLEDMVPLIKSTVPPKIEKMTVVAEQKVQYAGHEAYYFEVDLTSKGVTLHSVDYYLVVNGYLVHTTGTALKEFWSQRGPTILSSLATFKLL